MLRWGELCAGLFSLIQFKLSFNPMLYPFFFMYTNVSCTGGWWYTSVVNKPSSCFLFMCSAHFSVVNILIPKAVVYSVLLSSFCVSALVCFCLLLTLCLSVLADMISHACVVHC